MKKICDIMEENKEQQNFGNYYQPKLICKSELLSKISKTLKTQSDNLSILVPNGLQTTTTLYVPKPMQSCVFNDSVTHDNYIGHYGAGPENGICIWSKEKDGLKIKKQRKSIDCRISLFTYISSSSVFFAFCNDLTIRTYGNQFREYSRLQLRHSILSMLHDEERNLIVTGCVGFVQQWKLDTCLHKPPVLLREVTLLDNLSGITPWISYLYKDVEKQQIIALTGTGIFFLECESLNQAAFLENRHRFPLTSCLTFPPKKYLITASKEGSIKVWNMWMNTAPYVGSFSGHVRTILNLIIHPTEQILITASEDSTIRLWRIETFQEMYRFDVMDSLNSVSLSSTKTLYYTFSNGVRILDLSLIHSLHTLIGSRVLHISRTSCSSKPSRLLVVAEDGGARLISPVHGHVITTVFPIVTHKPKFYLHDMTDDKVYILLDGGDVLVICTKTNPCRTMLLWRTEIIDEKIICLQAVQWKINTEQITLLFGSHIDGRMSLLQGKGYKMKPVSHNRGIIIKIEACTTKVLTFYNFVTLNTEKCVSFWKIIPTHEKYVTIIKVHDISLERHPSCLCVNDFSLAVSMTQNMFFYKMAPITSESFTMEMFAPSKDESHKSRITQITANANLQIFASSSKDGRIKIWNLEGNLLRELAIGTYLSALAFANERGDMVIGFQGNLHFISVLNYLPPHYLEILMRDQFSDDEIEYCIPFDPTLKFWYDKRRVKTILTSQANETNKSLNCKAIRPSSATQQTKSCSPSNFYPKTRQFHLKALTKIRAWKNSTTRIQETEKEKDVVSSNQEETQMKLVSQTEEHVIPSSARDEKDDTGFPQGDAESQPDQKYWPCAPDGYIPNSIVRNKVTPKPYPAVVLATKQPWQPNVYDSFMDFSFEQFEDHDLSDEEECKRWCSSDDDNEDEEPEEDRVIESTSFEYYNINKQTRRDSKLTKLQMPSIVPPSFKKMKRMNTKMERIKSLRFEDDQLKEAVLEIDTDLVTKLESNRNVIPAPYDKYYKRDWFPKNVSFSVAEIVPMLLLQLCPTQPLELKEILQCIIDINRVCGITSPLLDAVLQNLYVLLENDCGKIRHYSVKTLLDMGVSRDEVILKLIQKLNDPVHYVREEVKTALKDLAGVVDMNSLSRKLQELGKLHKDHELAVQGTDVDVLQSFRQDIRAKRKNFKEKIAKLQQQFGRLDGRLTAWLDEMNKETLKRKHSRKNRRKKSNEMHVGGSAIQIRRNEERHNDNDQITLVDHVGSIQTESGTGRVNVNLNKNVEASCKNIDESCFAEEQSGYLPKLPPATVISKDDGKRNGGERFGVNMQGGHKLPQTDDRKRGMGDDCIAVERNRHALPPSLLYTSKTFKSGEKDISTVSCDVTEQSGLALPPNLPNAMLTLEDSRQWNVDESYVGSPALQPKNVNASPLDVNELEPNVTSTSKDNAQWRRCLLQRLIENETSMYEARDSLLTRFGKKDTGGKDYHQPTGDRPNKFANNSSLTAGLTQTLEKTILETALKALRSKRMEMSYQLNTVSNELLNDIHLVMKVAQKKELISNEEVGNTLMEVVFDLKRKCDERRNEHQSNDENDILRFNLVPSPYRRNALVPGVCGERIANLCTVLPELKPNTHESTRIKPIPERNGNLVAKESGKTNYGFLQLHWSSLIPEDDLLSRTLSKHEIPKPQLNPIKSSPRFHNPPPTNSTLNPKPILPSITKVASLNMPKINPQFLTSLPQPPNTAETNIR